ncbi:MAG: hypothetical protein OQJ76_02335 [Rhodospirillales bacterium]|nr:hypothetical protein [Rhodospirillales bacterium]
MNVAGAMGKRISDMTLLATGEPIDPGKEYVVGGWASVSPGTEGPEVYDLVSDHIERKKVVNMQPNRAVKVVNG